MPAGDFVPHLQLTEAEMSPPSEVKGDNLHGLQPCQWYIIDEEAMYCFWAWMENPLNRRSHTQETVAMLFGTSVINVFDCEHRAYHRARKKFPV